jgi:membrane protease YdiL (CAAX protease family)
VLLTAIYVATGTLLVPIVLHALIDIRMAVLPSNRPQMARAQAALGH